MLKKGRNIDDFVGENRLAYLGATPKQCLQIAYDNLIGMQKAILLFYSQQIRTGSGLSAAERQFVNMIDAEVNAVLRKLEVIDYKTEELMREQEGK